MKTITEADLVDYLAGELSPGRQQTVAAALQKDPALREEMRALEILMEEIVTLPEPGPSAAADVRFATMLAAATGKGTNASAEPVQRSGLRLAWSSRVLRAVAVAVAMLLIFVAGVQYGNAGLKQQHAANRTLLEEMADLMKAERTSERIRATTVTLELAEMDPETAANLGFLLRNDENANVRLAALEALRRFPDDARVRKELLAAMKESPPDVVRFELIETLVRCNEKRVLPYLQEIMEADTLPQPVRDVAEMASFKLI